VKRFLEVLLEIKFNDFSRTNPCFKCFQGLEFREKKIPGLSGTFKNAWEPWEDILPAPMLIITV